MTTPDAVPKTEVRPMDEVSVIAERFAARVERLADGDLAKPVPTCPAWRVRDLAAHVASSAAFHMAVLDGTAGYAADPQELDRIVADAIARVGEQTPVALAAAIRTGFAVLVERFRALPPDEPRAFQLGTSLLPDQIMAVVLGDLLVHGYDLARSTDLPWVIRPEEAAAVIDAVVPLLPHLVDEQAAAHHTANYELRLRRGRRHWLSFHDGAVQVDTATAREARIDCHISGDAVAMLLVTYGRISPARAALTAKSIAWGRRPWLAFSLMDRFQKP